MLNVMSLKIFSDMYTLRDHKHACDVLFNDTLNTFYFRLYGIGHMVKDHSDSECVCVCVRGDCGRNSARRSNPCAHSCISICVY